jgi:hypothetical protein
LSGQGIDQAHQAEALRKTEFESTLLRMLGENRLAGSTQETDMMNKLGDLLGMRGNDLIDMYNQLAQQEWERSMAQAQLDQEAALANAQMRNQYDIASMQEAGANSRASMGGGGGGGSGDDLGWAKLLMGLAGDEQDRLDTNTNNAANRANALEIARMSGGGGGKDPTDSIFEYLATGGDPASYAANRRTAEQLANGTWQPAAAPASSGGGWSPNFGGAASNLFGTKARAATTLGSLLGGPAWLGVNAYNFGRGLLD